MNNLQYAVPVGVPSPAPAEGPYHSQDTGFINSKQLAMRLSLPESWVRDQVRRRPIDPLPHFKFGKYVRFQCDSKEFQDWMSRRLIAPVAESGKSRRKPAIQ